MQPANLIIVRGLPGSGKTTFAHTISTNGHVYAADDYFTVDGAYNWDPTRLREAHVQCFRNVWDAFDHEADMVVVTNVFVHKSFYMEYVNTALNYNGYRAIRPTVVDLYDAGLTDFELHERCVHNVPWLTIKQMRQAWER